jgi:hypothetical protein
LALVLDGLDVVEAVRRDDFGDRDVVGTLGSCGPSPPTARRDDFGDRDVVGTGTGTPLYIG